MHAEDMGMHPVHPIEALASDLRTPPQVSRVLRERRKELGLTQVEVARRCGVSPQWLSGFENGKGSCGTHRMMRLVGVLGLSLAVHDRPHTLVDQVFDSLNDPDQDRDRD